VKLRGYVFLGGLGVRDRFTREQRPRVAMPVDHQVMELEQLVAEYHAGGQPGGPMRSVYEVCRTSDCEVGWGYEQAESAGSWN
jgi:hypothetical protein